jgi:hypothetical protein
MTFHSWVAGAGLICTPYQDRNLTAGRVKDGLAARLDP